MTEQDCTSGLCTTKVKKVPFTRTLWVWGNYAFYCQKSYSILLLPSPLGLQLLPHLSTLEGGSYV